MATALETTIKYPESLPFREICEIVRIIHGGQTVEKKEILANYLWHVQGYAMKMIIGNPESFTPQTEVDGLKELEKIIERSQENDISASVTIPWLKILLWIAKLLIEIYSE